MKESPRVEEVWAVWYPGIEGIGDAWYFLLLSFDDERWHALRLGDGTAFGSTGMIAKRRFDQSIKRIA